MVKSKIKKEKQYRLLNCGEKLKMGDSVWVAPIHSPPYWRDIISTFVGKVVDLSDPPIRRPM